MFTSEVVIRTLILQMLLHISPQPRILVALCTFHSSVQAPCKKVLDKVLSNDPGFAIFWILCTFYQSVSAFLVVRLLVKSPHLALWASNLASFTLRFLVMVNFRSRAFKFHVAFLATLLLKLTLRVKMLSILLHRHLLFASKCLILAMHLDF